MPCLQREAVFATLLALTAAAVARPAAAQDVKMGYVDGEKVLQAYKGYKDAESQFEKQRDAWNQEFEKRSRELKAMEEDFKAQQLMLSDDKRKERLTLLEDRRRELEKYYQDIMGPGGEAARKQEELLRPILDKVNQIIKEMGEQEKFLVIFDASNTGIAYASPDLDLTEKVIQRLNALSESGR
jgi:outer membrane protein